jgi:hypothetical protein
MGSIIAGCNCKEAQFPLNNTCSRIVAPPQHGALCKGLCILDACHRYDALKPDLQAVESADVNSQGGSPSETKFMIMMPALAKMNTIPTVCSVLFRWAPCPAGHRRHLTHALQVHRAMLN